MLDADGGYCQLAGSNIAQIRRPRWQGLPARANEIVELAGGLDPPDVDRRAGRNEIPDDGGLIVTQQRERPGECRDDLLYALLMREVCFKSQRCQVEPVQMRHPGRSDALSQKSTGACG